MSKPNSNVINNNDPVDIKPFLKKGVWRDVGEFFYNNFIEPFVQAVENLSVLRTRKWCELQLARIEQQEKLHTGV